MTWQEAQETKPATWQSALVSYKPDTGELTAALPVGPAFASRAQTQELLAGLPDELRIALKEKRKQKTLEVQVVPEGKRWRIIALRP